MTEYLHLIFLMRSMIQEGTKRTSSRDELLDMMFDRDEDFNDDDDGIGGILSR